MKLLLSLAVRNALRSPTRSGLTAVMVLLGTAILTVASAWIEGIFGGVIDAGADTTGHLRVVDPEYAQKEVLQPLYANIADSGTLAERLGQIDGVTGAYPRVTTGVTVTVGEEIGDVFALLVGTDPVALERHFGVRDGLEAGGWFTGKPHEVVLGATVAERAGAEIGDEVVLLGMTQDGSISPISGTVAGITRTGTSMVDQAVFVPLSRAQYLADVDSGATEILVYTHDRDAAPQFREAVRAIAGDGLLVQPWTEREPWASALGIVEVVRGILSAIIVFITALGVWNTMMMSVLERTSELGVMRAMGLGRMGVVGLVVAEAAGIAAIGGVLGVALGGLGATYLEVYGITLQEEVTQNMGSNFAVSTTLYADMNLSVGLTAFLLALSMAVVGSLLPALRAATIQPVDAIRHH